MARIGAWVAAFASAPWGKALAWAATADAWTGRVFLTCAGSRWLRGVALCVACGEGLECVRGVTPGVVTGGRGEGVAVGRGPGRAVGVVRVGACFGALCVVGLGEVFGVGLGAAFGVGFGAAFGVDLGAGCEVGRGAGLEVCRGFAGGSLGGLRRLPDPFELRAIRSTGGWAITGGEWSMASRDRVEIIWPPSRGATPRSSIGHLWALWYSTLVFDRRLSSFVTCLLILSGCGPGTLSFGEDREVLRTALARHEVVDGVAHASIVLSNGLFECELPQHDDPARAHQALQNLVAAACREGARHVSIQLWREPGGSWSGDYTGIGGGGPLDLSRSQPRVADAVFYSVDEAFLAQLEDLDRAYFVEERTLVSGASDGGAIRIDADGGVLKGSVTLPEVRVHADFTANWCDGTASLMRMLEGSPGYVCEFQ